MLISYCLFVNTYLNVYIGYTEWDIPIIYVRHTSVLSFVVGDRGANLPHHFPLLCMEHLIRNDWLWLGSCGQIEAERLREDIVGVHTSHHM